MRKLIPLFLILTALYNPVKAQCDASFTATVNGATAQFVSDTTRPGLLHKWKFGDGTQGFGSSTAHTYNASGVYQVLHTISDSSGFCNDSVFKNVTISFQATCQASFVSQKDSIFPNKYHFFSTSVAGGGSIQSYNWTINGNFVSSSPGFSQTLTQGLNHVCLTINTTAGCSSTVCDSILVDTSSNCHLNADFVATVRRDTVFLQSVDSGFNLLHSWKFGDGTTGFGRNTMHIYNFPGTYIITHYVTDSSSNCIDSAKKTVIINAQVSCKASFVIQKDSIIANRYNFFSTSTSSGGTISAYNWTINGSFASSASNFSKTLSQGKYLVCLTINTTAGCTSTKCDSLRVDTSVNCHLNANFTARVSRDTVFLAASDSTLHLLHQWKFGDGTQGFGRKLLHIYNAPGVYAITHIVRDSASQCVDSARQFVTISIASRCQASFVTIRDSVHPKQFTFISTSTAQGGTIAAYRWTLDGQAVSSANAFSTNLKKGVHMVCLTIKTSVGCVSTKCDSVLVDSIRTKDSIMYVASYPNPVPGGSVNLQLVLENHAKVKVTVYNSHGNVVYTKERNYSSGFNMLSIPVDDLQRGQYFVDIQYDNTRKRSIFQKL
jgi:hypothetical protein